MTEITSKLSTALADRYKIERHLGEGGMATVYLAHDLKHDRKVAVKVLRPELAAVLGAERFIQEIKTTANLQHPHILPLHDSGDADGFLYYVMPFIDGETLRDKLNRETQLGIDEAVNITTAIADALDYAHRQNVIHRDIKPENILLHDGRPMVADFGIALALSAAAGGRMTETGLSLGTPHYMSPEQATAEKDLTSRSDIYSLGCVLYEMLTGEPPHVGGSAQAIIMKIVTDDVRPVTELRKSVPPHVAAATAKSLEKLAADRFGTAKEFAEALTNPASTFPTIGAAPLVEAQARDPWKPVAIGATALAALFLFVAAWGWLRPGSETEKTITRFTISVPGGHEMLNGQFPLLALSPDGRTLVYYSEGQLFKRALDSFESEALAGTGGAGSPFFSPDGEWIGFVRGGTFQRISVDGGPVTDLARGAVASVLGARWGEDGTIVFAGGGTTGIRRIPATGGVPETVTVVDSTSESPHAWPELLDEGRLVLFTVVGPSGLWEDARVVVRDVETGERTTVAERGTFGRYVTSGHVVYVQADGTILAVPFDLANREVIGAPYPVESGVRVGYWGGGASFAVSDGGTAAFVRGSTWAINELWWVDRRGRRINGVGHPMTSEEFDLSPDGLRLVTGIFQPTGSDIFVLDASTGERSRVTFDGGHWAAIWSPDGRRIAYVSVGTGQAEIHVKEIDSSADPILFHASKYLDSPSSWSPDGDWIAFREIDPETQGNIYARRVDGADSLIHIATTQAHESWGQFSPDGRWIAYVSDADGASQVYVVSFPEIRGKRQVSTNGGRRPIWSASGDELFFWNGDTLMVAPVSIGASFDAEAPRPLFVLSGRRRGYDVTADGQRFLVHMRNPDAPAREIHVVENWLEVLKAKGGN